MSFIKINSAQELDQFLQMQNPGEKLVVRRDKETKQNVLGYTSELTFGEKFLRLFGAGGASLKRIANIEFAKQSASFSFLVDKHNLKRRFCKIESNTEDLIRNDSQFLMRYAVVAERALDVYDMSLQKMSSRKLKKEGKALEEIAHKVNEWHKAIEECSDWLIDVVNTYKRTDDMIPEEIISDIINMPKSAFLHKKEDGLYPYDYFKNDTKFSRVFMQRHDALEIEMEFQRLKLD